MKRNYLANHDIVIALDDFQDEDGNVLEVEKVVYRLLDQDGKVLIEDTEFDHSVKRLVISKEHNTVAPIDLDSITIENKGAVSVSQARTIEFDITLKDGNTVGDEVSYIIHPRERLVEGLNSFQTLAQANLTSGYINDVEAFTGDVTSAQRASALMEAYDHLTRLSFADVTLGQSYLNHSTAVDLNKLTPKEYRLLTENFKAALRKAQVAEANFILGGGDIIEQMRQSGLASQTIGETHETYRAGLPPTSSVCKVALAYVSDYLSGSKKIARA